MVADRPELHDVAKEQPGTVERMSKQWHQMAADVLHATKKECVPLADIASPQTHPEWTGAGDAEKPKLKKPGNSSKKQLEK